MKAVLPSFPPSSHARRAISYLPSCRTNVFPLRMRGSLAAGPARIIRRNDVSGGGGRENASKGIYCIRKEPSVQPCTKTLVVLPSTNQAQLADLADVFSTTLCYTGGQLFMVSKVQCLFWSETSTTEGRGGEKGESANFQKIAHRTFDTINSWPPVNINTNIPFLYSTGCPTARGILNTPFSQAKVNK